MSKKRPFYELPLNYPTGDGQDIEVHRDIAYLKEDDPAARMDIYLPAEETPQDGYAPVLFLHGGPLPAPGKRPLPKEWRVFRDYGTLAAENGLAGVVINHRYTGYEGLVQAIADVQEAVSFLAGQGSDYGIDGGRLAVWAFSGAGMLLSVLLRDSTKAPDCLVAFYPMLDLTHIPQAAQVYSENELMALSPLVQIEAMPRRLPMYFARAGLDRPGLNRALDTFVKQAFYHNLDLEVRNLPQSGHGFDMLEDTAGGQDAVARGLEFVKIKLSAED